MWEDGQSGIYQFTNTAKTAVQKTTVLADSHKDVPQLTNDLPEKVASLALQKVVVPHASRGIVNAVKVPSASALLGLVGIATPTEEDTGPDDGASVRLGRKPLVHPMACEVEKTVQQAHAAAHAVDEDAQSDAHSVFASHNIWDKFGTPNMAPAAKPAAKSKAKAKAAEPKAKNNKGGGGGKRANGGGDDGDDTAAESARKRRVSSLAPVPDADASSDGAKASCSMAKQMTEGDDKWTSETTHSLSHMLRITPGDEENEFKTYMSELSKNLSAQLQEVKTRKRQVKRRTQVNSEQALKSIESFETLIVEVISFLKNLKGGSSTGDDLFKTITFLQSNCVCKATFGLAIITRTTRCLLLDDLKWQRWEKMITVTFKFAQDAGRLAPDSGPDSSCGDFLSDFFAKQMCVLLQKLLKGLSDSAT